jgi:hypothetical protein
MIGSFLDHAVGFAQKGLRVFPLHGIRSGQCTCGKEQCSSPGKHPRILQWQEKASSDPAVVAALWKKWPDANVGLVTGESVVVLDVDGSEGEASLKALTDIHGELPETLTVITGRGRHLYFEVPNA